MITGFTLYRQFAQRSRQMMTESTERLTERAVVALEDYLTDMRQLLDAIYYDVIKDRDFGTETIDTEMNMFYESGKDRIVSLALYSLTGSLVSAAPSAIEKPGLEVDSETWFSRAINEVENFHFSLPHVQNLFDDPNYRYYWVISLSRAVRITVNGVPRSGVLLVDMNYSNIVQMLDDINAGNSTGQYMYLTD
ncbi:MAG: cache domain-containing protein, partial [Solobacterium sp.]|nr:cache domain-containing protein [Solobacterium sp.]